MATRKCIISSCTNTSKTTPEKNFIMVPTKDEKIRSEWFRIAGKQYLPKAYCHCCEDHFDLPNDAENYIRQKFMGGPVKLKPDVVPHKRLSISVCRICLLKIEDDDEECFSIAKPSIKFAKMLQMCLKDLDFSLTLHPVMCRLCYKKIEMFYNLRITALEHEVRLVSFIKKKTECLQEKIIPTGNDYKINFTENYKELRLDSSYSLDPSTSQQNPKHRKRKAKVCSESEKSAKTIQICDTPVKKPLKETEDIKIFVYTEQNNVTHEMNQYSGVSDLNGQPNKVLADDDQEIAKEEPLQVLSNNAEENNTQSILLQASEQQQIVEGGNISVENMINEDANKLYNSEVCQVVYLNQDGSGSFTTFNMLQVVDKTDEDLVESNCLFCDNYTDSNILEHCLTHCGLPVKCNLCQFTCENTTEDILNQHLFVHTVVASDVEDIS